MTITKRTCCYGLIVIKYWFCRYFAYLRLVWLHILALGKWGVRKFASIILLIIFLKIFFFVNFYSIIIFIQLFFLFIYFSIIFLPIVFLLSFFKYISFNYYSFFIFLLIIFLVISFIIFSLHYFYKVIKKKFTSDFFRSLKNFPMYSWIILWKWLFYVKKMKERNRVTYSIPIRILTISVLATTQVHNQQSTYSWLYTHFIAL